MKKAVQAKFQQNPHLGEKLVLTGNRPIHEHFKTDRFLGDKGDGTGISMLGKILMDIRRSFQKASHRLLGHIKFYNNLIPFRHSNWVFKKSTS